MDVIEMIAIRQAYENGARIEYRHRVFDKNWVEAHAEPDWNWEEFEYRVMEDAKSGGCMAYENAGEFEAAQTAHGPNIIFRGDRSHEEILVPKCPRDGSVCLESGEESLFMSYTCLVDSKLFRWQDGTPCGKMIVRV